MSCVFQNLAGLQNHYPQNQWQEILGNSDIQLFLGCVDELTAKYISDRSGEVSVNVQSRAKQLNQYENFKLYPAIQRNGRRRQKKAAYNG